MNTSFSKPFGRWSALVLSALIAALACSANAQQIDYNQQVKNKPSVNTVAPLIGGSVLNPVATISLNPCAAVQIYQTNPAANGWQCINLSFSNLSGTLLLGQTPLTSLGDTLYVNATPGLARLPGNTSTTKQYLSQTGTGSSSAAPAWAQIQFADVVGTVSSTQDPHALLSSFHTDTTPASPVRGDGIFVIGATTTWQRLAHPSTTGGYFKWNGTDIVGSNGAAGGTGSCAAHQWVSADNADGAPTCTQPGGSDLAAGTQTNQTLNGPSSGNAVTLCPGSGGEQGPTSALTGNSSDQTIYTYTLPANTLGVGKGLRLRTWMNHNSGTGSVSYKFSFGGVNYQSDGATTTGQLYSEIVVFNNSGVTNAQHGSNTENIHGSMQPFSPITSSVNTSSNVTIQTTFNAASTDQVTGGEFT